MSAAGLAAARLYTPAVAVWLSPAPDSVPPPGCRPGVAGSVTVMDRLTCAPTSGSLMATLANGWTGAELAVS